MSEEEEKTRSGELLGEFWESFGKFARESGFPLPPRFQPSDVETYSQVVSYLKSDLDQARIRILVFPQGDGKFTFFLLEREPHLTDSLGNLPELGLPLQRVNEIINREILLNLHSVYWNNPGDMVKFWTSFGQDEESLRHKFDATGVLLTHDLRERVALARSVTGNSLVSSTHEILQRELLGGSGEIETLRSAVVKLIVRENFSPQPSNPSKSVAFELTIGAVRDLLQDLRDVESRLQTKTEQS